MTYATQQHLEDRFGADMLRELTDRADPPAGAIDTDVVARALADTDALIDGHLQGRYQLPLAATPDLLTDLAQAVAIYKLHRHSAGDKVRRDYEDALKALQKIATGEIRLNVAGAEPAGTVSSSIETNGIVRPMSGGSMDGFI